MCRISLFLHIIHMLLYPIGNVMFAEYPIGTTCGYNVFFLQMWIIVKLHGLRSVSHFVPCDWALFDLSGFDG